LIQGVYDDALDFISRLERVQLVYSKSKAGVLEQVQVEREFDRIFGIHQERAQVTVHDLDRLVFDLIRRGFGLEISMTPEIDELLKG
jgi:hypothetical protein